MGHTPVRHPVELVPCSRLLVPQPHERLRAEGPRGSTISTSCAECDVHTHPFAPDSPPSGHLAFVCGHEPAAANERELPSLQAVPLHVEEHPEDGVERVSTLRGACRHTVSQEPGHGHTSHPTAPHLLPHVFYPAATLA